MSTDPQLSGGQVARFARDLTALGIAPTLERPLALAVSGGPDSMAMLWLAQQAFPDAIIAATVDHGLRIGSASETKMVAHWCASAGVSHRTLKRKGPVFRSAVQAQARRARYALLADWALAHDAVAIATAHHADDQAETFLMRANRGVGVAGLAGIRSRRDERVARRVPLPRHMYMAEERVIALVRPVLGWRRADLTAIVSSVGLPTVDDPSNADDRYERTAVRRLLAENSFLDPTQLARTARHAAETHETLSAMGAWLWQQRTIVPTGVDDPDDQIWLDMSDLPRELRRRLTKEAIDRVKIVNGITPDFDTSANIEPLIDALEGDRSATQAGVMATSKDGIWRFFEAPPRRTR